MTHTMQNFSSLSYYKKFDFLGATEGNASLINIENKVGAVGFVFRTLPSFILGRLLPVYVVKIDKTTGKPMRYPADR